MTNPTTHWLIRHVIDDGIERARERVAHGLATGWRAAATNASNNACWAGSLRRRVLGMPLHADGPAIGQLDAFDDVTRPRRDDEPGPEPVDRLVMDAVPAGAGRPHRLGRLRLGDDVDVVVVVEVPRGVAPADDVGEVLVQRAPEGDVEHLVTAADRQHRLVLGDRGAGEGEVDGVVFVAHLDQARMELVHAVLERRHVGTARQAQPIDAGHDVGGRLSHDIWVEQRRHGDRGTSGADDRLLVRPPECGRRDAPGVGGVGEPRRQGDHGAHRHQRTAGRPGNLRERRICGDPQ